MINLITGDLIDIASISSNGEAQFSVRSDRIVYFEVEAPDYLTYYSIPFILGRQTERTVYFKKSRIIYFKFGMQSEINIDTYEKEYCCRKLEDA